MVYCKVEASSVVEKGVSTSNSKRMIASDGSICVEQTDGSKTESGKDRGFRPGMMALRDMKMAWTLNDFIAMDDKYVFKIKRQDASWTDVSLDTNSCQDFYRYLSLFEFQRPRYGYLYGTAQQEEENKWNVRVECIYEPPQDDEEQDDPKEDTVEALASLLNLQRVGWIFGHAPRKDLELTSEEIITAAENQLEAAQGIKPTPFVTVKV